MALKENDFRKEIHLPIELKKELEVMAIQTDQGSLKAMIEKRTIYELAKWKQENKEL